MADQKLRKQNTVAFPITMTLDAVPENFAAVQDWIREHLASIPCSVRTLLELDMIVEEVFINIANYAYGNQIGKAWVDLFMDADSNCLTMIFRDKGTPYDPLKKETPDLTSPAEKRAIGGLGIFLVHEYSDSLSYEYKDGENRLTICKKLR